MAAFDSPSPATKTTCDVVVYSPPKPFASTEQNTERKQRSQALSPVPPHPYMERYKGDSGAANSFRRRWLLIDEANAL
jgi:hypothetical protein